MAKKIAGYNLPIQAIVLRYFNHRGYKIPSTYEALAFLMSEVGELADAINESASDAWVRNNPDVKHANVVQEAGDVLMMLIALLWGFDNDPITAMFENFEEKGYIHED